MARVIRATTPDEFPVGLAIMVERLAVDDRAGAAQGFAEDALYASRDRAGDETAPRRIADGRDAIALALPGDGVRLEPQICLHDGSNCFVEGRLLGSADATFTWSAQLDGDGLLTRVLAQRCRPVEPSPTWRRPLPESSTDAYAVLDRYFTNLQAGRFAEAVACFSPDVLYDHPSYVAGGPRVTFRGPDQLLDGFTRERPRSTVRQVVTTCLQAGLDGFVEGVVEGIPNGGSFVSSFTLDPNGLIERYVAFYTVSRVPRR
jgi:hypothetical protein